MPYFFGNKFFAIFYAHRDVFIIVSIFPFRVRFSSILLASRETMKIQTKPRHRFFRLGHIFANYSPSFYIPSSSQVINTMRHPAQDRYSTDPDFITRGKTGHIVSERQKKNLVYVISKESYLRMCVYGFYIRQFNNFLFYIIILEQN